MNIKQLKEEIEFYPDDLEVVFTTNGVTYKSISNVTWVFGTDSGYLVDKNQGEQKLVLVDLYSTKL